MYPNQSTVPNKSTPAPNLSTPGGPIYVPPPTFAPVPPVQQPVTTSPSVSTSSTARANTQANETYLGLVRGNMDNIAWNNAIQAKIKEQNAAIAAAEAAKAAESKKAADKTSAAITGASGGTQPTTPTSPTKEDIAASAAAQRKAEYDAKQAEINNQLNILQQNSDSRTAAILQQINTVFDGLVEQQKVTNEAYLKGTGTAGLVSGRAQYAPEIQEGLTVQAVSWGISKIADIQARRAKLINEAMEAKDSRDYKMWGERAKQLRDNYLDEQKAASDALEAAQKAAQAERDAEKARRDSIDWNAKQIAPMLNGMFTGNEEEDTALMFKTAEDAGIPVESLYKYVDEYSRGVEKDRIAALTSSQKELDAAIADGSVPRGTGLLEWQRIQANLHVNQKTDTPVSEKAQQIFDLYGDSIQEYLTAGNDPVTAIKLAVIDAESDNLKVDLSTRTELVKFAQALLDEMTGQANTTGDQTAPLPGEVPSGDSAYEEGKKVRSDVGSFFDLFNYWDEMIKQNSEEGNAARAKAVQERNDFWKGVIGQ